LGDLGRRVADHAGGWPQDIEWAYAAGEFFLLQSRDITGVGFSWDEDLEDYTRLPFEDDVVWTRAMSDEIWCGAVSPLMYSFRAEELQRMFAHMHTLWGFHESAHLRSLKYHKAEVYYNCQIDYINRTSLLPPALRDPQMFQYIPGTWMDRAKAEPFSPLKLAKLFLRLRVSDQDNNLYQWLKNARRRINTETPAQVDGLSDDDLRALSDARLKDYTEDRIDAAVDWFEDLWTGFFVHAPLAVTALGWILQNWCHESDPMVVADLITGLPSTTKTMEANAALGALAGEIRASELLTELFGKFEGAEFFRELEHVPEAKAFLDHYAEFVAVFGHQGHADRDIIFKRRVEDPSVDYRALQALFAAGDLTPPQETEKRLIARREAVTREVVDKIRREPLGSVKAEIFKLVQAYVLDMFVIRDDERHHSDRYTFAKKRAFAEIGRRVAERGIIASDYDAYFLSKSELYGLLDGVPVNARVLQAKITNRRKNFDAYRKDWMPPKYMVGNTFVDLDVAEQSDEGAVVFRGAATSRGCVTGPARLVPSLEGIGRVQKGDVLIVNSTDPGWTPVFMIISGLIMETGGMLAHGSCVSREYGIPAITLPGAMAHPRRGHHYGERGHRRDPHRGRMTHQRRLLRAA
jgi:pyruvate,water dikinase